MIERYSISNKACGKVKAATECFSCIVDLGKFNICATDGKLCDQLVAHVAHGEHGEWRREFKVF